MKPGQGERFFRPFVSTSQSADPILGQGMGLGLPLARRIVEEYGGKIEFTTPTKGYSAAVKAVFPGK